MPSEYRIEDLKVYQRLCELHIRVCDISKRWPSEERFELASQIRRSSNSAPANLAEKHSDRHMKNKIEGVNRARGEALETVHHLYIARLKGYVSSTVYESLREAYLECVRMLNGMERAFDSKLEHRVQRWPRPAQSDPTSPDSEP
jgi:four helix bundle protein